MAFCTNCGKEIAEGVKFCANCGAAVSSDIQVNPVNITTPENPNAGANGNWNARENMNSYPNADPTRAYAIPPQPVPEPTGIDKFGKFFWIPLVILTIVDFVSDPAILTIILSAAIIGGAIFALSRKYKFKGFSIICLILTAICLLCGVSQAKKVGLFRIPGKGELSSTSTVDEDYDIEDIAPADTTPNTQTADPKPESDTKQERAPEAKSENSTDDSASVQTGGVDPDLKAFLDSYEKFVDEYVDFMKKYMANPTDLSLLAEYTDMMTELSDFETKLDKYDSNSMSTEDAAYYLEVTTRCTQKMLEIL